MTTTRVRAADGASGPGRVAGTTRPSRLSRLAGAIVEKLAPNTEADPVAILTQLLVACGAMIGHDAFFQVEATRHHPNEFVLLVGDTAKARKGSSFDHVARLLSRSAPEFPVACHNRPVQR